MNSKASTKTAVKNKHKKHGKESVSLQALIKGTLSRVFCLKPNYEKCTVTWVHKIVGL